MSLAVPVVRGLHAAGVPLLVANGRVYDRAALAALISAARRAAY